MSGAVPLLRYMPSWRGQGQIYLFIFIGVFQTAEQ